MTVTPHSNKAGCTTSGLAGAPLGVVSASQYVIAGQSDLFTRVGFPLSNCSEKVLGTGLGSSSSTSLSSLSSLMLPFLVVERLFVRGQIMQMCHSLRCKLLAENMESLGTSFL